MEDNFTAQYVFDYAVPRLLSENPQLARKINAVLGIEIIGERGGYWTLDLTGNPVVERGRTKEPKCTVCAYSEDFEALVSGGSVRLALEAFKSKRIQATGHLPTILKLESIIFGLAKRN